MPETTHDDPLAALLRDAFDGVEPVTPIECLKPRPRPAWVAVAAAAAVVAVLSSLIYLGVATTRTDNTKTATAPATNPPPASASAVTLRLLLVRSTVAAGGTINGTLIVDNRSGKAIEATGCFPNDIQVKLVSPSAPPNGWLTMGGCPLYRISPGTHSYPVKVYADYSVCGSPTAEVPACNSKGVADLVPGPYETDVKADGLPAGTPEAPALTVRVVARP